MTTTPKPFTHQIAGTNFWLEKDITANFSDPGTGKTRATLDAIAQRNSPGRALVIAPLSILASSWGEDIKKFTPQLTYAIADAKNRQQAFDSGAKIVLINPDGVKAIVKDLSWLKDFDTLVVDESTAFKHHNSQRSKALAKISEHIRYKIILTGTPNSNTVCDLWHQIYLLDEGKRLGKNFNQFRISVCNPSIVDTGGGKTAVKWVDKPNANAVVSAALADITFRVKFEDVLEIPPNLTRNIYVDQPPKLMKMYRDFMRDSVLMLQSGEITAMNAGVRVRKALQFLTGAVYDETGGIHTIHHDRYNLVMDLVEETDACVVAFNWRHERLALCEEAERRKLTYAVIDGDTPFEQRGDIVRAFQNGELRVVIAHPQSAGHGLTLTRGNRTIWASPTYNAEHYQQFCRRIYRAGQTRKTETIHIAARGTIEESVYSRLGDKLDAMDELLKYAKELTD
ncbi:SNF2-related protein [Gallibacterium anatis]|uniref:SNF2-related protein n=1 Tax=Gallibacterium anatis TaxID=750 RepID=UPI0039FBBE83